ncbi:hydroxyquinol 1,2-dioxygenase [Burkholderiaceae bacterium 16]|nr:hydroxyquinol 1,2-dioxygenase [Burkholderiaceae bacterium 16]
MSTNIAKHFVFAIALIAAAAGAQAAGLSQGSTRDPYTDGARSVQEQRSPYTDGARLVQGPRDPYADGARNVDPYYDGANA